jgi:hypothetical protein
MRRLRSGRALGVGEPWSSSPPHQRHLFALGERVVRPPARTRDFAGANWPSASPSSFAASTKASTGRRPRRGCGATPLVLGGKPGRRCPIDRRAVLFASRPARSGLTAALNETSVVLVSDHGFGAPAGSRTRSSCSVPSACRELAAFQAGSLTAGAHAHCRRAGRRGHRRRDDAARDASTEGVVEWVGRAGRWR